MQSVRTVVKRGHRRCGRDEMRTEAAEIEFVIRLYNFKTLS